MLKRLVSLVAAAALALTTTGCINLGLFPARGPLVETRLEGPRRAPKILLIDIQGAIEETGNDETWLSPPSEGTAARVLEQLDRARKDGSVKAILLRVDSPGGSATASDLIFQEIRRFKQERHVPVVAQFMSVAASGGYYLSMAADEVRALPTSVTGSIGVIFVGVSFAGLMDKLGIYDQTLVSGPFKDAGSPFRKMTPRERAQLQTIIDDLYARFVSVVDEGRPKLDEAAVRKLADGRVYSARQALDNGLVDAIGNVEDSVDRLKQLAGLETAQVVTYHRQREWRSNLYTRGPEQPPSLHLELGSLLGTQLPRPGFHYLWWPVTR